MARPYMLLFINQLMSATAILRFWTLVLAAYTFLDEERDRLHNQEQHPVTIGDARREVQRLHRWHLLHLAFFHL